jgi:hypothetical protein
LVFTLSGATAWVVSSGGAIWRSCLAAANHFT